MRTTADPSENDLAGLFEDRAAARRGRLSRAVRRWWYVVAGRAPQRGRLTRFPPGPAPRGRQAG